MIEVAIAKSEITSKGWYRNGTYAYGGYQGVVLLVFLAICLLVVIVRKLEIREREWTKKSAPTNRRAQRNADMKRRAKERRLTLDESKKKQ